MVAIRSMNARILQLERMLLGNGKSIWILTLDCSYLSLLQFTASQSREPRKKQKRTKEGLSELTSRLETTLVSNRERSTVHADFAFVSPIDANALISIPESPNYEPAIGDVIEFVIVTE